MAIPKVFREVQDQLIFDGKYMEVYLPENYFEDDLAVEIGNEIETIGIFNFKLFPSKDATTGTIHTMLLPASVSLIPSSSENKATLSLFKEAEPEKYRILQFEPNDVFIKNLNITQNANNSYRFIKLLHGGRIPATVKYEDVLQLYTDNLEINGVNLGVPSSILELIISEIYRDRKDITVPFRKVIGKSTTVGQLDYKAVNMKKVAEINSTFTAVAFENINEALISSVSKSKNKKEENISPIEKIIKY